MSNYIEYKDKVYFHPGYYIDELVEESGLTQADFAKRLGTTPKNLSELIRGKQKLSIDIATKLARMYGSSVKYWLGLQLAYDEGLSEINSANELEKERKIFGALEYKYFRENYGLPDLPRKIDEQIKCVREFLCVSSLDVLRSEDFSVAFRSKEKFSEENVISANAMVQIAINETLRRKTPQFDKVKFERAVRYASTQTVNHDDFIEKISKRFEDAGVVLVVLPNLKNSGISGATKKVDDRMMILIDKRYPYEDVFWFTLFHEIGHVLEGNVGITAEDNESEMDLFVRDALIPDKEYQMFVGENTYYNEELIREFAARIERDPGIVAGRLFKDGKLRRGQMDLYNKLRVKYDSAV